MKNILHIFIGGDIGGIEVLIKDFAIRSKHNNTIVSLWGEGSLADEMQANGIDFINLQGSSHRIMFLVRKLVAIIDKLNIDVLVVHHASPVSHLCALIISYKKPRLKIVTYAHGNAFGMYRGDEKIGLTIRKAIMRRSLNHADRVVAISKSVKNSIIHEFNLKPEKITVIYNGIDLTRFKPAVRKPDGKCRLIFVGRLIKFKGVQVVLEALSKIQNDCEWEYIIVGEGSYRKELEDLTHKYRLDDKVTFMGARRDVPELLSEADIFLHVSIGEEGFGISIVEAMACGKICVGSRIGAIPEIIEDNENGFLMTPGDVGELATLLEHIINSRDSWNKIQENAIAKAKDFDVTTFVNRLDELLETA